eukprot:TRINITY_DN3416_c0_g1_i1.p1 TRINITY_DN3416_c0_g1~~TRINITY_DN3416_c0_g1_i1.p1  ORF type:complete len:159 (+),score=39.27 TRINITY_DN3416_c0_g1_i1:64-540(+)
MDWKNVFTSPCFLKCKTALLTDSFGPKSVTCLDECMKEAEKSKLPQSQSPASPPDNSQIEVTVKSKDGRFAPFQKTMALSDLGDQVTDWAKWGGQKSTEVAEVTLSTVMDKSLTVLKMAKDRAKQANMDSVIVVETSTNLGFAQLTFKTIVESPKQQQ